MILHGINRQTKLFSYFFMRQSLFRLNSKISRWRGLNCSKACAINSSNILFFQTLLYIIYIINGLFHRFSYSTDRADRERNIS